MIHVCRRAELEAQLALLAPRRLISVVDPEDLPSTPRGLTTASHLRLGIHDVVGPLAGCVPCGPPHVEQLERFIGDWAGSGPLLIHCRLGVSRSTAVALVAAVAGLGREPHAAARALRVAAPHANPNGLIVEIADQVLRLGGRLVAARIAMGPPVPVPFGPPVTLAFPP
jgi:predicted protein tyrosine phosphatase